MPPDPAQRPVRLLMPVEADPPSLLPSLPAPSAEQTIDLPAALQHAGAVNPTIGLGEEAVQASMAEQLQAQVLMLPTLHAGASFDLHRGRLETAHGVLEDVNRQSAYAGAGASAVGAGTVTVPGVWLTAQLAEAWFEPQIAQARVTARRFDAVATRNRVLLAVARQYLVLAGAWARLRMLDESRHELDEVVRVTAAFAESRQGRPGDAQRARANLQLLQATRQRTEEEAAVAAAELARLLDLDPGTRLRPPASPVAAVELVDPQTDLEGLIQRALTNRPEIGARSADVAASAMLVRQERARPLLPFVQVGLSAGQFGGGSDLADSRFGHTSGRVDVDALAVWSLENLGLGNVAVGRRRRAEWVEAQAQRMRVADEIRRQVSEARARAVSRRQQLDLAGQRLGHAKEAYRLDWLRTRNLQGLPILVLDSLRLLTAARLDLVRAQVEYSQAQFELYAALGAPLETAVLRLAQGSPLLARPNRP